MYILSTLGHIRRCVVFDVVSYQTLGIFNVKSSYVESFNVQSFDVKSFDVQSFNVRQVNREMYSRIGSDQAYKSPKIMDLLKLFVLKTYCPAYLFLITPRTC